MENMIRSLTARVLVLKRIKEQVKQDGLRGCLRKKIWKREGKKGQRLMYLGENLKFQDK